MSRTPAYTYVLLTSISLSQPPFSCALVPICPHYPACYAPKNGLVISSQTCEISRNCSTNIHLAQIVEPSLQQEADQLHSAWSANWDGLEDNQQQVDEVLGAVDAMRLSTLELLKSLD